MHTSFSVKEAIRIGWEHFKKRPFFLIGLFVMTTIISALTGGVADSVTTGIAGGVTNILDYAIQIILSMGITFILFRVYDEVETGYADLFKPLHLFWSYLVAGVLLSVVVVLGFVLFIIPGIIASIALMFVAYLIIDRELGPIGAIKESMRITKGHRWNLLFFTLVLIMLNIAGALFFGVGLLVTVPVSALATMYVYRWLLEPDTDGGVAVSLLSKIISTLGVLCIVGGSLIVLFIVLGGVRSDTTITAAFRDTQRRADLVLIRDAANNYFNTNNIFPATLETLSPEYVATIPLDPISFAPYVYTVSNVGTSFSVCASLEDTTNGNLYCESGHPFGTDVSTTSATSTEQNVEVWQL